MSIKSYSDFTENFYSLKYVFVDVFGNYRKFFLEHVLEKNGKILVKFKNFNFPEEVEFLLGKEIFIEEKQTKELSKSEFYIHDLVNSKVKYKEKFFGIVTDVLSLKSNDVLVIERFDHVEVLIPFISDYVSEVRSNQKEVLLINSEDFLKND